MTEQNAENARVDVSKNKSVVVKAFSIARLVLVLLLLVMLVFIGIRYMRGDHQSESGFIRVFVVIVVMVTVLSILMAVLKLS